MKSFSDTQDAVQTKRKVKALYVHDISSRFYRISLLK
jgi:hypothetical protein